MAIGTLSSEAREELPQTLFGYEVKSRLGVGAASVIYAVKDPKDSQAYALKHVVRRESSDDRFIAQLQNEFRVMENVRHPGLRRCINLIVNKTFFIKVKEAALVMELVEGIGLDERPPKDQRAVLDIFRQTARALWVLHQQQYVHCDLKPHNMLLTRSGAVKLIDFGQTVKVGTVKARMQGTPDFIAPEQVKLGPMTVRTDVYCFGASLYWALTGKRIPTYLTVEKSERDTIRESKFPSPQQLNANVSEDLSKLVMECVRMMPKDRPADMAQVLARLTM